MTKKRRENERRYAVGARWTLVARILLLGVIGQL